MNFSKILAMITAAWTSIVSPITSAFGIQNTEENIAQQEIIDVTALNINFEVENTEAYQAYETELSNEINGNLNMPQESGNEFIKQKSLDDTTKSELSTDFITFMKAQKPVEIKSASVNDIYKKNKQELTETVEQKKPVNQQVNNKKPATTKPTTSTSQASTTKPATSVPTTPTPSTSVTPAPSTPVTPTPSTPVTPAPSTPAAPSAGDGADISAGGWSSDQL